MAEPATKLPINTEAPPATQPAKTTDWQPFETLRSQIDRLFHDFQTGVANAHHNGDGTHGQSHPTLHFHHPSSGRMKLFVLPPGKFDRHQWQAQHIASGLVAI